MIIPVYNEQNTIRDVLARVRAVAIEGVEKEIIVVDDGSTDGTALLVAEEVARGDVRAVYHPANSGKGAAVRTGLAHARGDYVIIQDADLELDPAEYPRLLAPILAGQCQVVYGSRFQAGWHGIPLSLALGNWVLTRVTNLLYGASLTDMETCYKVLPALLMQNLRLQAQRFDIEPEITAKLLQRGYRIHEVPVSYQYRDYRQGKKIGWRDGVMALWVLFKYRFLAR